MGDFICSPVFPYIQSPDLFFFYTNKLPIYVDYPDVLKFGFALSCLFQKWAEKRQLISVTIVAPPLGVFWEEVLYKHKALCKDGCIHPHNISWGGCAVNIVRTKLPVPQIEQRWFSFTARRVTTFLSHFLRGIIHWIALCMPAYVYLSDHSKMSPEDLFRRKEISQAFKFIHMHGIPTANPMGRDYCGILKYKGVEHLLNKKRNTSALDSHAL